MEALGRIPEVGDSFESDGLAVEVLEMEGRRIEKLHITDTREPDSEDDDDKHKKHKKDPDEETV